MIEYILIVVAAGGAVYIAERVLNKKSLNKEKNNDMSGLIDIDFSDIDAEIKKGQEEAEAYFARMEEFKKRNDLDYRLEKQFEFLVNEAQDTIAAAIGENIDERRAQRLVADGYKVIESTPIGSKYKQYTVTQLPTGAIKDDGAKGDTQYGRLTPDKQLKYRDDLDQVEDENWHGLKPAPKPLARSGKHYTDEEIRQMIKLRNLYNESN